MRVRRGLWFFIFLTGLAKADAPPPAVAFVDEFQTGCLKGAADGGGRGAARPTDPRFQLVHSNNANFGSVRQIILGPTQHASGGAALGCGDHGRTLQQVKIFFKSIERLLETAVI
jgi:hypothetical protein